MMIRDKIMIIAAGHDGPIPCAWITSTNADGFLYCFTKPTYTIVQDWIIRFDSEARHLSNDRRWLSILAMSTIMAFSSQKENVILILSNTFGFKLGFAWLPMERININSQLTSSPRHIWIEQFERAYQIENVHRQIERNVIQMFRRFRVDTDDFISSKMLHAIDHISCLCSPVTKIIQMTRFNRHFS